jgi:Fe-S-cluster containining protein
MGHHQVGINIGPVHLFDFQAYECNGCGRCCDKPWKVTIDPHQLAGIEASAAYQRRTRPGFVPLAVEDGGFARLAHTESGGCVFRNQEKRCSLHAELGLYGKPRGCQLFPYQPQDTPDGTYVHLSFGCPQVVAGSGRGVEEDRAHLAHVLAYRRALAPVPGVDDFTVQLTQDVSISWESYLKLEERILQAFDLSNPCESLLKTVLAILRCDADQPWPDLTPTRAEDISFAQEMLAKFLGNIAASLEVLENEDDWQAFSRAVESGQPVASQEFGTVIPGMSLEAPAEEFLREIINRYVRNAVLGKALLKSTVVERLLVCACVIPLVSFYGRAYQTARDESSLTLEAVTLAFEKIEIGVATHTRSLAHVFAGMADTFAEIAALPEEWL